MAIQLGNQKIYILLNKRMMRCMPKQMLWGGKLYCGRGEALGYVGDRGKTNRSFVDIPSIGECIKQGTMGNIFLKKRYVIIIGDEKILVRLK